MSSSSGWKVGSSVRISGLVGAPQHNGKVGRLRGKLKDPRRVAVELSDGTVLNMKRDNLELAPVVPSIPPTPSSAPVDKSSRTLERQVGLLEEFDRSPDPESLALYYHIRDGAFDCYNALEYHDQLCAYYAAGMTVVAVLPRTIRGNVYLLVCLQHGDAEQNTFCDVAFQCARQFVGISVLLKRRCLVCHMPGAPVCACQCACFCSAACAATGRDKHEKLCKLVGASKVVVEEESIELFN